jgi:RDD family
LEGVGVREILSATGAVLARRRLPILVVAISVALPAAILLRVSGSALLLSVVGDVLSLVATTTFVLILLRDLQSAPLAYRSIIPTVAGATLRIVAAAVILGALLVLALIVPFAAATQTLNRSSAGFVLEVLLLPIEFLAAPLYLFIPVCVNETGGPWWAIKRAWALSGPGRSQVLMLIGGLLVSTDVLSWLLRSSPASVAILAALLLSVANAVLQAGLLAVLYSQLTKAEAALAPSRPPQPIVVLETEGLVVAPMGLRVAAWLVDALLLVLLVVIGTTLLGPAIDGTTSWFTTWSWLLLAGLSAIYLITSWAIAGATLGQGLLYLRVFSESEGRRLSVARAALRWFGLFGWTLVAFGSALVGPSGVGASLRLLAVGWLVALLVSASMDRRHQGFHDRFARSWVVGRAEDLQPELPRPQRPATRSPEATIAHRRKPGRQGRHKAR